MSVNKVILIGNIGKEPEFNKSNPEAPFARFSIATTEKYKDRAGTLQSLTTWHRIVAWRGLSNLLEKYTKSGSKIYLEGRLRENKYTDKEGIERRSVEILADVIQLLDSRENGSGAKEEVGHDTSSDSTNFSTSREPHEPYQTLNGNPPPSPSDMKEMDDDLPF